MTGWKWTAISPCRRKAPFSVKDFDDLSQDGIWPFLAAYMQYLPTILAKSNNLSNNDRRNDPYNPHPVLLLVDNVGIKNEELHI